MIQQSKSAKSVKMLAEDRQPKGSEVYTVLALQVIYQEWPVIRANWKQPIGVLDVDLGQVATLTHDADEPCCLVERGVFARKFFL